MKTLGLLPLVDDLVEVPVMIMSLPGVLMGFRASCDAWMLCDRMLCDKAETRLNPLPQPFSAVFSGDSIPCDCLEGGKVMVTDCAFVVPWWWRRRLLVLPGPILRRRFHPSSWTSIPDHESGWQFWTTEKYLIPLAAPRA